MDRRQFLGVAAGAGAIGWLGHYFFGEPAWAGDDDAKKAVAAMGDVKVRTAVLSSSTLVRGIVTVFNWFNIQNKVFSPKDALGALEFVGVSEVGRTSVWATVEALAKQLGRVETVDSARASFTCGEAA